MESIYYITTLEQGDFELQFSNKYQLSDDIENISGIFAPDQQYFSQGSIKKLDEIIENHSKEISIIPKLPSSTKFEVKTLLGTLKLYLHTSKFTVIRDIWLLFLIECQRREWNFPSDQFSLTHNGKVLGLSEYLNDLEINSSFELEEIPAYPYIDPKFVYIESNNGNIYVVEIDTCETIEALKFKISDKLSIPPDQQRIIFRFCQLDDQKSLESYNIQNQDTLKLALRLRGGGMPTTFSFNSMDSPDNQKFSIAAPDWRTVHQGISFIGICDNQLCPAFNQQVISNFGFGVFDINKIKLSATCPECKQVLLKVTGCGFFACKFKFLGVLADGRKKEGTGKAGTQNYCAFNKGQEDDWKFLRIQVESS